MHTENKKMTLFNVIPTSSSIPFILLFTSTTTTSLLFYYIMTFSMIMMMIPTIQGQIASTDGCISLQGSNSCRGFQHYYIGTTAINNLLSVDASTFNTISDLDDALIDYTHTSSDYMSPLGCIADSTNTTGNNSTTYPYARYALSRLCAGLVQDTQTSLPCNYAKNIQPLPLCQSTCQEWVDSVTNMTNTTTVCTNISQRRQQALLQLDDSCQSWSGYNGHSPQCINGTTNEPDNCGFNDNNSGACAYCYNNPADSCCQSIKCNKLSAGAIAGIVIGCLLAVGGLIGCFLFFFCCKKKRIRRETSFSFKTYIQPSTQPKTNNGVFDASDDHNSSHKVLIDNDSQFQYYNQKMNNFNNNNNSYNNRSPTTPTFPPNATPLTNNTTLNSDYHGGNSDNNSHRRGSSSASNPFGDRFEVISLQNQSIKSVIPTKPTPLVTLDTTSTISTTTNGTHHPPPLLPPQHIDRDENGIGIGKNKLGKEGDEEGPLYDEEFHQVIHPYPPQMVDELGLNVGDIVCLAMEFDDGWALGFNVNTGLKGVFPLVCVSPLPPQVLEQLYQDGKKNDEFSSSKVLLEDSASLNSIQYTQPQPPPQLESINTHHHLNNNNNNNNNLQQQQSPLALHNIRKIREDLRRSMSLSSSSNYSYSSNNHSPSFKHLSRSHTFISSPQTSPNSTTSPSTNIPKRTASMMRSKQQQQQQYHDDDLISPTHDTPLVSFPPPTSPSKIVLPTSPKTESFEMYNHRISKLQQDF